MRTRIYECRVSWCKGVSSMAKVTAEFEDNMTIKELEKEIKEKMAKEFSNKLRIFTPEEVRLKLQQKF